MSDPSAANAIRLELGWTKQQALTFVRRSKYEACVHAKDQNISLKEALVRLARTKEGPPELRAMQVLEGSE